MNPAFFDHRTSLTKLVVSSLVVLALTLLSSRRAAADLAEATDFSAPWTSGGGPELIGPGYWVAQSAASIDGVDAAEGRMGSGVFENWIETTVAGPTTLYYSYRVKNFTGFSGTLPGFFLIIGENSTLISPAQEGEGMDTDTGWREASAEIPEGVQTIRWRLSFRHGATPVRAYVDQVWTSNDERPRVTIASTQTGRCAMPFTWAVPVASSTPATLTATGLPAGLTLDPVTRVISGTPTEPGIFDATLTAINSAGQHVVRVVFDIEPGSTTIAEGIDAPGRIFSQQRWEGVTGIGHDGADSARGLGTTFAETFAEKDSILSTTFNGPGTLTFWYRGEKHGAINLYVGIAVSAPPTQLLAEKVWTKVTVPIPEGPQTVSWEGVLHVKADGERIARFVYLDELTYVGHEPEIAVEGQPQSSDIVDGGAQSFGEVILNASTSVTFTLKNTGIANLTGLIPTIDGPDATDFAITSSPVSPVSGPTGSTALTVEFRPTTRGPKTAVLHIPSNDPDENPFDINLSGTGLGITSHPASREVVQGTPVSFLVTVEGPLPSFQWQKDGVDIPDAVASTLVIPSAQPWHIGEYTVRISRGNGSILSDTATLELTGVPSPLWRGLVACYPFDGSPQDVCRPNKPAVLLNTAGLAADPQRGGAVQIRGTGWATPPLPDEPVELQGPGGYLQIPRPPLVDGEPFTISFVIKEEGFTHRHGEALFTMGEAASSTDLLAHFWISGLDGLPEVYTGPTQVFETSASDFLQDGWAVTLNSPWTTYTAVGDGNLVRLYRNGQLMGSSDYKKDTLGDFFMGRHWWENGGRFSTRLVAKVDDVRIYNRALAAPEVQELYRLVQTTPAAGSLESWALIHGLSGTDAAKTGDPDRDGLPNWEEYCFGTSPTDETASLIKALFSGGTLTLEWLEITGVGYELKESSTLLAPWSASAVIPTLASNQNGVPAGYKRMRATIPIPAGHQSPNRFFRVEAAAAP